MIVNVSSGVSGIVVAWESWRVGHGVSCGNVYTSGFVLVKSDVIRCDLVVRGEGKGVIEKTVIGDLSEVICLTCHVEDQRDCMPSWEKRCKASVYHVHSFPVGAKRPRRPLSGRCD